MARKVTTTVKSNSSGHLCVYFCLWLCAQLLLTLLAIGLVLWMVNGYGIADDTNTLPTALTLTDDTLNTMDLFHGTDNSTASFLDWVNGTLEDPNKQQVELLDVLCNCTDGQLVGMDEIYGHRFEKHAYPLHVLRNCTFNVSDELIQYLRNIADKGDPQCFVWSCFVNLPNEVNGLTKQEVAAPFFCIWDLLILKTNEAAGIDLYDIQRNCYQYTTNVTCRAALSSPEADGNGTSSESELSEEDSEETDYFSFRYLFPSLEAEWHRQPPGYFHEDEATEMKFGRKKRAASWKDYLKQGSKEDNKTFFAVVKDGQPITKKLGEGKNPYQTRFQPNVDQKPEMSIPVPQPNKEPQQQIPRFQPNVDQKPEMSIPVPQPNKEPQQQIQCSSDDYDFYPDPQRNCSVLYICKQGIATRMVCDEGLLHFNPISKLCDYPEKVHCQLKCPHPQGKFHVPGFCDLYLECLVGQSRIVKCPEGLHFNAIMSQCDMPENTACDIKCSSDDNRLVPMPGRCDMYAKCTEGKVFYYLCPEGLEFNPLTLQCDLPQNAGCSLQCPYPNGVFPVIGKCHMFYRCLNNTLVVHTCSRGLHFNARTLTCDLPESAACNVACKKEQDGFYPVQGDCSSFLMCQNGYGLVKTCPDGKHFNFLEKRCDLPEFAKCELNCLEDEGMYELYGHCDSYLHCVNGKPHVGTCPNGLLFNKFILLCDKPKNVNCLTWSP